MSLRPEQQQPSPMSVPSYPNIPIPDPTVRTAEDIAKARAEIRDEFKQQITSLEKHLVTRLEGMDKAVVLLAETVNRVPTVLDRDITTVRNLFNERLVGVMSALDERTLGIKTQFAERDMRIAVSDEADKTAVMAALQAQKEAVSSALAAQKEIAAAQNLANSEAVKKSEAGFTKEIDALKSLINVSLEAMNGRIINLQSRVDRGEGTNVGVQHERTETRLGMGAVVGVVAAAVGVLSLIAALGFGVISNSRSISAAPTVVSPAVVPLNPR